MSMFLPARIHIVLTRIAATAGLWTRTIQQIPVLNALRAKNMRHSDLQDEVIKAALHRDYVLRSKNTMTEAAYFDALGVAEYMLDSAVAAFVKWRDTNDSTSK